MKVFEVPVFGSAVDSKGDVWKRRCGVGPAYRSSSRPDGGNKVLQQRTIAERAQRLFALSPHGVR